MENFSVIKIILVLTPKHSSYREENNSIPAKTSTMSYKILQISQTPRIPEEIF